jgi:hypothetical protein
MTIRQMPPHGREPATGSNLEEYKPVEGHVSTASPGYKHTRGGALVPIAVAMVATVLISCAFRVAKQHVKELLASIIGSIPSFFRRLQQSPGLLTAGLRRA